MGVLNALAYPSGQHDESEREGVGKGETTFLPDSIFNFRAHQCNSGSDLWASELEIQTAAVPLNERLSSMMRMSEQYAVHYTVHIVQ